MTSVPSSRRMRVPNRRGSTRGTKRAVRGVLRLSSWISGRLMASASCLTFSSSPIVDSIAPGFSAAGGTSSKSVTGREGSGSLSLKVMNSFSGVKRRQAPWYQNPSSLSTAFSGQRSGRLRTGHCGGRVFCSSTPHLPNTFQESQQVSHLLNAHLFFQAVRHHRDIADVHAPDVLP